MYGISRLARLEPTGIFIQLWCAIQYLTQAARDRIVPKIKMVLSDSSYQWSTRDSNKAIYECLSTATSHRPALPTEIIFQILNHTSRWVCSFEKADKPAPPIPHAPILVSANPSGRLEIKVILSTPPMTSEGLLNIRRLVFTFESKDQGWSGYRGDHGTYNNTWSWFEAGVRSKDKDSTYADTASESTHDSYKRFHLQRNRHAGRDTESYRIELEKESEIIRGLKPGDVIDLLACAQYPAWQNQVYSAGIEIWSYSDPTRPEAS